MFSSQQGEVLNQCSFIKLWKRLLIAQMFCYLVGLCFDCASVRVSAGLNKSNLRLSKTIMNYI